MSSDCARKLLDAAGTPIFLAKAGQQIHCGERSKLRRLDVKELPRRVVCYQDAIVGTKQEHS